MILYPLIRAARIVTCIAILPEDQIAAATIAESLSSIVPLINNGLPIGSYIVPFFSFPRETLSLLYSYNRQNYEQVELGFLLIIILLFYTYT
tara:strand:+ start:977 stop:1252 length:276 start_codon:yes stop_codon:yes gene_type:complete